MRPGLYFMAAAVGMVDGAVHASPVQGTIQVSGYVPSSCRIASPVAARCSVPMIQRLTEAGRPGQKIAREATPRFTVTPLI